MALRFNQIIRRHIEPRGPKPFGQLDFDPTLGRVASDASC